MIFNKPNFKTMLAAGLASTVLVACGGGSGDGEKEILAADAEALKRSAISSFGAVSDMNTNAAISVANSNSEVITGTLGDVATGGSDTFPEEIDTELAVQQNVQSLFSASLATGNSDNSTTSRTGNTLSINPDELELCADQELFGDLTADDRADCELLMADLTVELLATAEESGVITYHFQEEDLFSVGYGANDEFVEVDLGGMKTFLNTAAIIDTGEELPGLPSTLTGALRFAALATNQTLGSEAGSISFDIVKPIKIVSTTDDGTTDVSIAEGTLFAVEADAAAGTGSLSFDVGAISLLAPDDGRIGRVNLAGYTGNADINPENGELIVSNLGLSKGPLSISIDNNEILSMTLGAFGFRTTEGTDLEPGKLIMNGNMDLSLILNNLTEYEADSDISSAILSVMMPSGTSLSVAPNGSTQVGGVGPFSFSASATDVDGDVNTESVTVNSGECFDSLAGSGSSDDSEEFQVDVFINEDGNIVEVDNSQSEPMMDSDSVVQSCE